MSCFARRRTLQLLGEQHRVNAFRSPLANNAQRIVNQSRTMRMKRGSTDFYATAQRQDERLLRRLEAQLEQAQARVKREEEEAAEMIKMQQQRKVPVTSTQNSTEDHSTYFWDIILSEQDRAKLAQYGIENFDQLYTLQAEAEAATKQPPYPSIGDLDDTHRVAYEMYAQIPEKVAGKRPSKWRLGFGGF